MTDRLPALPKSIVRLREHDGRGGEPAWLEGQVREAQRAAVEDALEAAAKRCDAIATRHQAARNTEREGAADECAIEIRALKETYRV